MNRFAAYLLAATIVAASLSSIAAFGDMRISVSPDVVQLTNGDHSASMNLSNARVELTTPYRTYHLRTSIQDDGNWAEPTHAGAKPKVVKNAGLITVTAVYPVSSNRSFTLQLSVYKDAPGIYMLSRLTNLGSARSDYYFWSWEGGFDDFFVPEGSGIQKRTADPQNWTRFGRSNWAYLPGDNGGLAVFSKCTLGRGPSGDRSVFLNALPNSQYLVKGQSLDMGMGVVGAKGPEETAKLYSIVHDKKIPALNIGVAQPKITGIDYGKPAPKWAQNLEVYNCFPWLTYAPKICTDENIHDWFAPFKLMSHVPNDKSVIEKCHKAGIKVLMYVNYMEILDSAAQKSIGEKGQWYLDSNWRQIVDHENMDIARHQNWKAYFSDGKPMQSVWGAQTNVPGLFSTCCHQPDLHDAAIAQLKKIMELGVDGVFIDNAADIRECFGDKFGKHTHPDSGRSNTDAYMAILKDVYKVVKSYGSDKIVMHNSGFRPEQWAFCDVQMAESIIYGSGVTQKMNEWETFRYTGEMQADAIKHGKVGVILNYFFDQPPAVRIPHALYTLAYARFYGFAWGDWFTLLGNEENKDNSRLARELYSVRLGKPLSKVQNTGDVYYRIFQNGIVVLNSSGAAGNITITLPKDGRLSDTCYDRVLTTKGKKLSLDIDPDAGRVLIWK